MTTTGVSTSVGTTAPNYYKGLEFMNDSSVTVSIDQEDFTCADLGDNTITLTVTDNAGNSSTCTTTVTVEDNVAPVANCVAPFTVQLDANGQASITADDVDDGSSDNCGDSMLVGASPYDDTLSFIDPATYTETGTPLSITVNGTAVNGVNGMDRSPTDGLLYIIVKPNGGGRRLATLDTTTGKATLIGSGNLSLIHI